MQKRSPDNGWAVKTIAGAAILALAAGCGAAQAQALSASAPAAAASGAEAAGDAAQRVVVTGSRARARTVFDSAVPVDLFSGPQLTQSLATGEAGQLLQALDPSINMPRVSASGTSDTVRTIQLRGLAPDETLVLVNGKRRHASAVMDTEGLFPGTVSVDINAIPASAIEAVEVLRDGAGAQYGSDAVAGVVNFRLKDSAAGGSASITVGADSTHFAPTGRRITDGQSIVLGADRGLRLGDGGFLHFGGDAVHKKGTNRAGPTRAADASENDTAADQALDGQVLYKSGDPDQHGGDLWYNAALPLGGGLRAYSFATFGQRDSRGGAFFRWPGDVENVPSVYPNGYRPQTTNRDRDVSWVGGLAQSSADWTIDASARLGQNEFDYGVEHSLNASLGAGSPTAFHLADFRLRQLALNLDASRELAAPGLAEPASLALGAELMHEGYRSRPGDPASYAAGPDTGAPPGAQAGPGLEPADAVDLGRWVKSAYADVDLPVTRRLLLDVAARWSGYGGSGDAVTGKLAGRYKLTDALLLRGSVSNSFRAPALAQTGFRFTTLNFNQDGTGLQNDALLPASDPLARAFGAQRLKPELSTNLSVGAAWKATGTATLSVDAYRIHVRNRITRSSDLQSDAVSAYLASIGRTDIASVAFLTNALDTTTQGLDLVAGDALPLAGGTLNLNAALNFNRTRIDRVRNGSAALAAIDPSLTLLTPQSLLVVKRGSPTSKLVLGGDWSGGRWGVTGRVTRYGAVYDQSFDPAAPVIDGAGAQRYGANWSTDLELSYRVTPQATVALGGNNVFDRYPDRTYAGSTLGGALPYDYIAPIGINGAFYYGRLAVTF
jgi:iron complex outermembrane receptor protein